MIIVQDKNKNILSIHTTVSKYAVVYGIRESNCKYIREKIKNAGGSSRISYKRHYLTKIYPSK